MPELGPGERPVHVFPLEAHLDPVAVPPAESIHRSENLRRIGWRVHKLHSDVMEVVVTQPLFHLCKIGRRHVVESSTHSQSSPRRFMSERRSRPWGYGFRQLTHG